MQLTKQEHNHILRTQDLKLKMSNAKEITKEKQPVRRLVITVFYLWPHRTKSLSILDLEGQYGQHNMRSKNASRSWSHMPQILQREFQKALLSGVCNFQND